MVSMLIVIAILVLLEYIPIGYEGYMPSTVKNSPESMYTNTDNLTRINSGSSSNAVTSWSTIPSNEIARTMDATENEDIETKMTGVVTATTTAVSEENKLMQDNFHWEPPVVKWSWQWIELGWRGLVDVETAKLLSKDCSFDPSVFNESAVMCSLLQVPAFTRLARALAENSSSILETAARVAVWTALHTKYIPDGEGVEYVYTPAETLARGGGDCEDRALLEAVLLIAAGIDNVVLVSFEFNDTDVGHVEAGVIVNGTLYLLPPVNASLPLELEDYAGYMLLQGYKLASIKVYKVKVSRSDGALVIRVGAEELKPPMPPIEPWRPSRSYLDVLETEVLQLIEGLYGKPPCPGFVQRVVDWMVGYLPEQEPPMIPIGYYMYAVPITLYKSKPLSYAIVEARIYLALMLAQGLDHWLQEGNHLCVAVHAEAENVEMQLFRYTPGGALKAYTGLAPATVLYVFSGPWLPWFTANVTLEDGLLVIHSKSNITSILVYGAGTGDDLVELVGVAKPGAFYPGLETVEAFNWTTEYNVSLIVVEYSKLLGAVEEKASRLGVEPPFLLVVWSGDRELCEILLVPRDDGG